MNRPKLKTLVTVVLCSAFAFTSIAVAGPVLVGNTQVVAKVAAVLTCSSLYEGGMVRMKGGSSEGYTKICYCISDGAASPAYKWCSAQFTAAATTFTCTGGSATVCP